jgi:hypothetical protein
LNDLGMILERKMRMVDFITTWNGGAFISGVLYLFVWLVMIAYDLRFHKFSKPQILVFSVLISLLIFFVYLLSVHTPIIVGSFVFTRLIIDSLQYDNA